MQEFKNFLKAATEGTERTVEFAQNVLEGNDGKEVKVTLVKKTEEPVRAESKKRRHIFYCAEEFAEYLEKYGSEDVVILADVCERMIEAVLDEEDKKGRERIALKTQTHPLFVPWSNMPGCMQVTDFAKFILGQRRVIVSPDGKDLAMTLSQIRVSQKIEILAGIGKHCINGITCEQTIKGQVQKENVELPDEITVKVPLFVGTDPVEFIVDLTVVCDRDRQIFVNMSSPDLEEKIIEEFNKMLAFLKNMSPFDSVIVGQGLIQYAPWSYIDKY